MVYRRDEDALKVLMKNMDELHERIREAKARLENTTTSFLKTFLYSIITATALGLLASLTGMFRVSGDTGPLSTELKSLPPPLLIIFLIVITLFGSEIGIISHYIWRMGNMADHLRDIAALLLIEREISKIIGRRVLLSRTFIEKINEFISDIASQSWAFIHLFIPNWFIYFVLYLGIFFNIYQPCFNGFPSSIRGQLQSLFQIITASQFLVSIIIISILGGYRCGIKYPNRGKMVARIVVGVIVIITTLILLYSNLLDSIIILKELKNFLSNILSYIPFMDRIPKYAPLLYHICAEQPFCMLIILPFSITLLISSLLGFFLYRKEILPVSIVIHLMKRDQLICQGNENMGAQEAGDANGVQPANEGNAGNEGGGGGQNQGGGFKQALVNFIANLLFVCILSIRYTEKELESIRSQIRDEIQPSFCD